MMLNRRRPICCDSDIFSSMRSSHRAWLLNGAAALSLLLCLATAALWVRSRTWIDDVRYASRVDARRSQWEVQLDSRVGVCCIFWTRREQTIPVRDVFGGGFRSFAVSRRDTRPFTGFNSDDPQPLGFGVAHSHMVDPPSGAWERRWTYSAVSCRIGFWC